MAAPIALVAKEQLVGDRGGRSLWWATAPAIEPIAPLAQALRAQIAVIGAGYTGLSAALHLAEAGRDVVVLDAMDLGEGASGRNGGQVIPGLKYDPDTLEGMFGGGLGAKLVATAAAGPDLVFELIRKHGIDCEAVRNGWLQLAATESALEAIGVRARQWQARGAAVESLSEAEAARLTGTQRYYGGLIDRRGGTVQPLAYLRGLAAAARRGGTRLFTHSGATHLERSGGEWLIRTRAGSVSCRQVVFATNAYSDKFVEPLQRTIVAIPSLQVATAPLPPHLSRSILPEGQAVSDTWRLLRYFRKDAQGRLIMGSRGVFGDVQPAQAASLHYRAVREIYPQLAGISFDYTWAGFVAMTPDHLPHLHEVAPGIVAGLGYNGRGVAMATTMGTLLARRLLGEDAEDLGFPVTPVRPMPLHRFSRFAAGTAIQYLRALDGVARMAERIRRRKRTTSTWAAWIRGRPD
jgi:glycine/D-amino acid oxidase-like deaminating enzyme